MVKYSDFDNEAIKLIRENVDKQIQISSLLNDIEGNLILDVAPQDHAGAKAHFNVATVKTLDIDPKSGADIIADLCDLLSPNMPNDYFDHVICTEVLEHTLNPFKAVNNLHYMLKPGGSILVTTPYNFRIHGPAPDNWRFTNSGLQTLFARYFTEIYINEIETPGRPNMPIGYTLRAMKSYED